MKGQERGGKQLIFYVGPGDKHSLSMKCYSLSQIPLKAIDLAINAMILRITIRSFKGTLLLFFQSLAIFSIISHLRIAVAFF